MVFSTLELKKSTLATWTWSERSNQTQCVSDVFTCGSHFIVCNNVWVYFPQWAAAARSFNCRAAAHVQTMLQGPNTDVYCCFPPPDWTATVRLVLSLTPAELNQSSPSITVCSGLNGNLYIQTAAMQPNTYRDMMSGPHRPTQLFYIYSFNKTHNNKSFKSSLLVETSAWLIKQLSLTPRRKLNVAQVPS